MSKILWQQTLIPDSSTPTTNLEDANYKLQVENVRRYEKATNDITIPDPKAIRSMSRAAVFLSHLAMNGKDAFAPFLAKSPFTIGIYCATENGPIDAESSAKIIAQNDPARFAEFYRKFRNPKMYLKQLPNLVPAQMGISMGLQGPMNVYTHSTAGSIQALEQAEWDLQSNIVEAALVCTAHAFDDFLVVMRERQTDQRRISEGAAAVLLTKNGEITDWNKKLKRNPKDFFGIADQIINVLTEG